MLICSACFKACRLFSQYPDMQCSTTSTFLVVVSKFSFKNGSQTQNFSFKIDPQTQTVRAFFGPPHQIRGTEGLELGGQQKPCNNLLLACRRSPTVTKGQQEVQLTVHSLPQCEDEMRTEV